jgi:hypothetical protein
MHAGERGDADALVEVERVKMFLKVLEWPGPDRKCTEYMTIDQFKKRPVLPNPFEIETSCLENLEKHQPAPVPHIKKPGSAGSAMAETFLKARERQNGKK